LWWRPKRLPPIKLQEHWRVLNDCCNLVQIRAARHRTRRHGRPAPGSPAAKGHPHVVRIKIFAGLNDLAVANLMYEAMPIIIESAIIQPGNDIHLLNDAISLR